MTPWPRQESNGKTSMHLLKTLFSRQWWWVTLLVIGLMLVLARLGLWQLNRLEQRRVANAQLAAVLAGQTLDLNLDELPQDTAELENRQVKAGGQFDFDNQLILKVQNWQGRAGVHLITPLVFSDGETAVLVDRGWIPDAENTAENLPKYEAPGQVEINGFAALPQLIGGKSTGPPENPQAEWYRVDIEAIQPQIPYKLLPVYVLQSPARNSELPYRDEPEIDLSEGSHLSYAIQWFIFSLGLGSGYVLYVRKRLQDEKRAAVQEAPVTPETSQNVDG